ncbi:metallophosphoesterase [Parapedobacter indicus]|uniref:3',5'-cyclic AMP phosphodiesterase CpdA n=1 Tax=Parapedobacter indicus TaxID=1477437 RepID=A0A1I3KGS7_9SPHI|nr:metallophosphoesterase [Parapedobacter indicus]PPL01811.1 3',5'-cyclic AMP phosphodiesterase CpdA [Parapedobacter indicus]SFI71395.1 3',5'-cyclic AMP phosphodiesterase CpdA [Parapedobacter indicus]
MNKPIFFLLCAFLSVATGIAQTKFSITHGPYLQALHETGVTIVWTTDKDAIGWVELAPDDSSHFYLKERPKYFASSHGFKDVSKLHKVTLRGLQPGVRYRYRIYAQEVTSHEGTDVNYGEVAATQVYRRAPLAFTTSRPDQTELSFAVINDIHGRNEVMKNLLSQLDWPQTDFVFFNGDMANNLVSEEQLFAHYMDTATALFASEIPMYYARGNHETRGNFASAFPDYFPTTSGHLYYLFRRGPVCFVVLDCGEDKPDSDMEYSGIVNMDAYRTQQAEWLKEALERPEYREAPYKVVICHMPPFGGWHGEQEIAEKFVPLLNAAGAQIMLSGHLHRHIKREAQPGAHQFPILVNSNNNMLRATANGQQLRIDVVDQSGKTVDSITLKPSR